MPTFHELYKDVQYRIRYWEISYRQKYYSTDKNPRVIQTKLPNQKLISLRTLPHDKYLIKPGEFLSVSYEPDKSSAMVVEKHNKSRFNIQPKDYENYLESRNGKKLFGGFDDTVIGSPMKSQPLRRVKSVTDLVSLQAQEEEEEEEEDATAEDKILSASSLNTFSLLSPSLLPKIPSGKSIRRFIKSPWAKLTPLPEQNDPPGSPRKSDKILPPSRVQSIVSKLSAPSCIERKTCPCTKCSARRPSSPANNENDQDPVLEIQPWTKIYNDISLTAARVSTGSLPSSRHDFDNLSSDFVRPKLVNKNLDNIRKCSAKSNECSSFLDLYSDDTDLLSMYNY